MSKEPPPLALSEDQRDELMVVVREQLTIHAEMFSRLGAQSGVASLAIAELFEDVGNRYLDMAEALAEARRTAGS